MASEPKSHTERSLDRQIVLEEDEYTAALSSIIARDFFPSLAHLDATNEYLDAVHSQDPHLIGASIHRLQQIQTPLIPSSAHRTPRQTPSRIPYGSGLTETPHGQPPTKRPRFDTTLSLDAFQACYTSEDNSSFTRILESENQTRRERWSWAWNAQKRVEAQQDRMISARERMLIEAPPVTGVKEKFAIEVPTLAGLVTDGAAEVEEATGDEARQGSETENTSMEKSVVLSHTAEAAQVDVMAPTKDTRSATVDGWRFKARNSLMFPPDADDSPHHMVNLAEASSVPKVIKYGNTRFGEDNNTSSASPSQSSPPSPTRSRVEAAITGTPYRPKSPTGSRDFSLVPNIPSPTASELGPAAVKQLMTWGTLNATPRIVTPLDDPNNGPDLNTSFHLPAISHREVISHKLSNRASKSLRAKAGLLGLTPGIGQSKTASARTGKRGDMLPPSWTPRRADAAGSLTPAARRLLDRTAMGASAARRTEAMEQSARWENAKRKDKDLNRIRWTPTPTH